LSQELSGVYTSRHPAAYPISAYSYIVTQCARAGDRPTCKGNYGNAGVSETLRQWLRYIACDGQVEMANIGYSPLPPNLSQEIANSIARMYGDRAPERLTPANCANPRFHGGGLPLSPPPPPVGNERSGNSGGTTGPGGGANGPGTSAAGSGASATATTAAGAGDEVAAGREGATEAVGGGSGDWRDADPVAYDRPGLKPLGLPPLVVLLAVLAVPPLVVGAVRWLRRPRF
jgi:phosphate transport system substrate-binding protein